MNKQRRTNNKYIGTGGLKANTPSLKVKSQVLKPELHPSMEYSQVSGSNLWPISKSNKSKTPSIKSSKNGGPAASFTKDKIKKSKYAHNFKQVGMPQDGGFSNQDYTSKGLRTLLSQGNPNNKIGEYKDENTGLNDSTTSVVEGYDHEPLEITIDFPLNQNPGALMGNKHTGPRRKKVGKGSYQRGTTAPKTKMVLAPHRNPTNKKVRVIDRPSKRNRPKNTSGSSRFSGGGLVASLYESF